jgi:hypothetical protein
MHTPSMVACAVEGATSRRMIICKECIGPTEKGHLCKGVWAQPGPGGAGKGPGRRPARFAPFFSPVDPF